MARVFPCSHPLILEKLAALRASATRPPEFRRLVRAPGLAGRLRGRGRLADEGRRGHHPARHGGGKAIADPVLIVPILRAGLGMADGVLDMLPDAEVWHIGLKRDEKTLLPDEYYRKLPAHAREATVFIVDPMLATGGSAVHACELIKTFDPPRIKFLALIAAPEGIAHLTGAMPDVCVHVGVIDERLNEADTSTPASATPGIASSPPSSATTEAPHDPRAVARPPARRPPPDPDLVPIIAGLEKTEAMIRDLSVATDYVKLQKYPFKVEKPIRMGFRTEFILTRDGKTWYDCLGEQVNSGADGVKTYLGHWRSRLRRRDRTVADRRRPRRLAFRRDRPASVVAWRQPARIHDPLQPRAREQDPQGTTSHLRRPRRVAGPARCDDRDPGDDQWRGVEVALLDRPGTPDRRPPRPDARAQPREVALAGILADRVRDHKEIVPGVWPPMRFKYESVDPPKDGKPEELSWSFEGNELRLEGQPGPARVDLPSRIPPDVRVTDHRNP